MPLTIHLMFREGCLLGAVKLARSLPVCLRQHLSLANILYGYMVLPVYLHHNPVIHLSPPLYPRPVVKSGPLIHSMPRCRSCLRSPPHLMKNTTHFLLLCRRKLSSTPTRMPSVALPVVHLHHRNFHFLLHNLRNQLIIYESLIIILTYHLSCIGIGIDGDEVYMKVKMQVVAYHEVLIHRR